jgi:hypothetical protein
MDHVGDFFYDEDEETEVDDSLARHDDEADDCAGALSDDDEDVGDPVPLRNTRSMRARLIGQDVTAKVKNTLRFMDSQSINLPIFLDALSWGDPGCHSDPKVQYARTALMVSDELPGILERWYKPPRTQREKKGGRPAGAQQTLREFALQCVSGCVDREMKISAPLFLSPPDVMSEEHLTSLNFSNLKSKVIQTAPIFWNILRIAAYSQRQGIRNKHKDPDMVCASSYLPKVTSMFHQVILNIISQCQYTRSHRRGRIAKVWSLYLKACGLSARAFDAIHSLGISMSHKWAANAYGHLSERAMQAARTAIQKSPWLISHDNVNVPLRVFSQRLNNQSHFVSGCAASVYILPQEAALPPDTNRLFQKFRAQKCKEVFAFEDVLYGDEAADERIEAQYIYRVLRILLDSPEFKEYQVRRRGA